MSKQVPTVSAFAENDVASLYSHFGAFSRKNQYRELVMEEAAHNAAARWPLLAEVLEPNADEANPL